MSATMMLGRYLEGSSWMHRLDPRSKALSIPLFAAGVFLADGYASVFVLLLFVCVIIRSTGIPVRYYVRAVKPLIFIIGFVLVFHLLYDAGGNRLLAFGSVRIYAGGLEKGIVSAMRMSLFIVFAAALTFTTQPEHMSHGLARLLRPLEAVGLPAGRFALMLGMGLRFIPTLLKEAERLWKAQQSRGLALAGKPLRDKARLTVALLVPVTAGAVRRAVLLADAMESRGYRLGTPRSLYRRFAWKRADTLFIASFMLPMAASLLL